MKKLFVFVLVFAILLSGCRKVPEVIEPTEIENGEVLEETSSVPEKEQEKEPEKIYFRFEESEEPKALSIGDYLGKWKLESFETSAKATEAVFSGKTEIKGYLYISEMTAENPVYLFEVDEKYLSNFPVSPEEERTSLTLQINPESKIYSEIPVYSKERLHCSLVINEYNYIFTPMSVYSSIKADSGDFWVEIEMNEPEIIAKHIAALNEITLETYGMADTDFELDFIPLYKEPLSGITFDKTPDLIVTIPELEQYPDYYQNQSLENLQKFSNFKSEQEIFEYLSQWVSPEFFDTENFRKHIFEFDGNAYLARYSRGYGIKSYGNAEIISKTETEMIAKIFIYDVKSVEAGTAEIKFEKNGENWILVSVTDNYYR